MPGDRVHVVHHGVSRAILAARDELASEEVDAVIERHVGRSDYVLAVSTLYRFKNYERLMRAFATIKAELTSPLRLVIAGSDADLTKEHLAAFAGKLGVGDDVVFLGGVGQRQLAALYMRARMLCYPSLYETFGHPIVEAMACGCPVVTSTVSSTAELAAGAAELVDPRDEASIAAGMRRLLFDAARREELSRLGRDRVKDFTWEKSAEKTLAIIRAVAAARRGAAGAGVARSRVCFQ